MKMNMKMNLNMLIKGSSEGLKKRKKLYMDSDFSDQIENQNTFNQTDEEKIFILNKGSNLISI